MRLRTLKVGCFGGGTGLPSLLGGLKTNAWVDPHAIVTMFDSGGSSGPLRDEFGVPAPGQVIQFATALAPHEAGGRPNPHGPLHGAPHGEVSRHHSGQPPATTCGAATRALSRRASASTQRAA